jgi:hypothetical protein
MSLRTSRGAKNAANGEVAGAPVNRLSAVLSAGVCRYCTGVGLHDLPQFETQVGSLECNICLETLQPQDDQGWKEVYQQHRAAVGPSNTYKYWTVACSAYPFPHMFHMVCLAKHIRDTKASVATCPDCRAPLATESLENEDMQKVMIALGATRDDDMSDDSYSDMGSIFGDEEELSPRARRHNERVRERELLGRNRNRFVVPSDELSEGDADDSEVEDDGGG